MENTVADLLQFNETLNMTVGSTNNKPPYVSFFKINGKPILPPLINEENRRELQKYRQKAVEIELKLAKQKLKNTAKSYQISSEASSIVNVSPSRQSTPARPATLNLNDISSVKGFTLMKSKTEGSLSKHKNDIPVDYEITSSHPSAKSLNRAFKSTLEQRLASEDCIISRNKLNKYQQSPIIEEQIPDKLLDSEGDNKRERKIWSPLKIDSLNSLRIELPSKDTLMTDDNVDASLDESQNTPETVTQSPSLMRQNSYTLLTPSPALLNFLESQKEQFAERPQSGRKTWDLAKAKKNWNPHGESLGKVSDEEGSLEECEIQCTSKKISSSLDSLSALQNSRLNSDADCHECSMQNSLPYDSGTSPDSYKAKRSTAKSTKVKCKLKGKKVRTVKCVPSPSTVDKVPFESHTKLTQGSLRDSVPSELSDLSNLLLKMKVDHERQKKELEQKQHSEMKKLEIIFQRKEAEFLSKVSLLPKKSTKSIYSRISWESRREDMPDSDLLMKGDGNYHPGRKAVSLSEHCLSPYIQSRRPHSAKDFHLQFYSNENDCNRRAKSIDLNQGNQDTDLDVSFQDDFMQSKDTTLNNEYVIDSDSISNFSSHSSTGSTDNREDPASVSHLKKFQGITSEEYAKYNQAATLITAAARGFLTRRLLRTAHVQGLITTLRDAITCATQLHSASDIRDSDIDLMRRLGRQIEAAWDAVYAVFFNTETATKLQLIAADRERLRAAVTKTPAPTVKKKRISSATKKSLDRKKGGSIMSKSQTSNGFSRARTCSKMSASYPSPYFPEKLK